MNSRSLLRLCLVVLLGTFFRTCSGEAFFLPDIGPDPGPDPAGSNAAAISAANANTIGGNNGRFGSGLAANGNLAVAGEIHAGNGRPVPPVDGPDNIIIFPRPQVRPMPPMHPMPPPPPQRDSCHHGGYPHPYMNQQQHREMYRKAIEEVMWEFVPLMEKNGSSIHKNGTSNMTSSTDPHHPQLQSQAHDPLGLSASNQSSAIPRSLMSPADPLSPQSTGPDSPETQESPKISNSSSSNYSSSSPRYVIYY